MCQWPLNVKSTIRKARASPTQTWIALGKMVATYNFAASPLLLCMISTRVAVPKLWFLCSCLSRKDVGPNGPNNKHSLEDNLWHVASTTSTVASLRVARLGWLPSQAKLPLHDGWRWTWQMCQWPWNVKSTIGKAKLPQDKPGSSWENWSLPTTSQLHLSCTAWSRDFSLISAKFLAPSSYDAKFVDFSSPKIFRKEVEAVMSFRWA